MADVTLVLDNADGLLPVDFQVLELGRRLYRSGENDYLLNKQRIRLRDLVDLLDAAHLADNAFLFIGQGMVDQALALRPEERRPLFEEVAGVRRHERRRRRPRSSWSSPRRTSRASRTSSPSCGRRPGGWPPRPSSRPAARHDRPRSWRRRSCSTHARPLVRRVRRALAAATRTRERAAGRGRSARWRS